MAEQQTLDIQPIDQKLDIQPLDIQPINTAPPKLVESEKGNSLWNYIQSTRPVKFANEFITKHADELAQQKPGILNPNPEENPLINKPMLPETTNSGGILGTARHAIYDNLIRPMSSPLGILGGILDANPPSEPIGLPKTKLNLPEELPKLNVPEELIKSEPKLLGPAPSHIENPPRFISGRAGIADTTTPYKMDVGPIGRDTGELGTVLPHEMGEVVPISPEFAAEHGTSLGHPLRDPEALSGLNVDESVGNLGRTDLPYQLPTAPKTAESLFGPEHANNPVAKSIAKATNEVHSPELDVAVSDPSFVNKFIGPINSPTRTSSGSRVLANLTSSMDTELTKQNPYLGELVKQTQVDSHIQAGTWVTQFENIIKGITKSEESKLVDAIEGKVQLDPNTDSKLFKMLNGYKALNQEVSDAAVNSGMGLKLNDGTKLIPWQPRDNYWPHMYPEEVLSQLKNNPMQARANMLAEGMSPLEIDNILSNSKRYGERLINAQHGRETDLPGYRKDMNVYKKHLSDMAKRITEATNYGPMDLADTESPLTQLVNESRNPEYSGNLMKKLLNRGVYDQDSMDSNKVTRSMTAAQAWLHLTTSGISNLNTIAMIPIQNNATSFIRGLSEYALDNARTGEFANSSGALTNIFREIFAEGVKNHKYSPTNLYGLDAGERFMRTVSAATGRAYAKQLFQTLKDNPDKLNPTAMKSLQNLILERPEKVLLQPELSSKQIQRAAFRSAELSQGIAEQQNLPKAWTGSGIANLLTLFHKYQFTQTKAIKDLVVSNPARAIPLLLGASQIAGELTGDSKAFITGGLNQAFGNEKGIGDTISERGKFWESRLGVDAVTARVIENAVQSFALGTYGDALELMSGNGSDALKQLMGSTAGDAIKIFDILRATASGDTDKASQGLLKMIPTVGRPLAEAVK